MPPVTPVSLNLMVVYIIIYIFGEVGILSERFEWRDDSFFFKVIFIIIWRELDPIVVLIFSNGDRGCNLFKEGLGIGIFIEERASPSKTILYSLNNDKKKPKRRSPRLSQQKFRTEELNTYTLNFLICSRDGLETKLKTFVNRKKCVWTRIKSK